MRFERNPNRTTGRIGHLNQPSPTPRSSPECVSEIPITDTPPSFFQRIKRGLLRRDQRLRCALAAFVLLALLIFWRPLQRECLTFLLLRSDAPSPEVLSEVIERTSDPKSLLLRFWNTQRIPHRHFVLSYLGRIVNSESNLFRAMESVVVDATSDADVTTRELAFAALTRTKHPQLRQLALEQLEDADPAVRLLGLQSLRSIARSNDVPVAIRMLNDPDARVIVSAGLVLRQATGQDFGIKSSLALPRFTSIDNTNSAPPPDLAAINQGVQRWRDWWKDHQAEYPESLQPQRKPRSIARLTALDFRLGDSEGKIEHLSDYRGKVVLLAFWTLDAPVSLDDVPALDALRSRSAESVTVLGICVPPAPSCADEHNQGNEHAHHDHAASSPPLETEQGRTLVQQTMLERKSNFPMLIDSKGIVGSRFNVEELPTYVLIDRQGMIRRRFVGNRTKPVLEAMVKDVTENKMAHAETP